MKKLMTLIVFLTFSGQVLADCLPHYERKISRIEAWRGPTRGATINGSIGTTAAQGSLVALGTFNPAGAITAGAVVLASGATFAYASLRKSAYNKAYMAIKEAYKGEGRHLDKFQRNVEKKLGKQVPSEELAQYLMEVNETEEACYLESKDKYKPLTNRKLRKLVLKKLGS